MTICVTTSFRPSSSQESQAKELAESLEASYKERRKESKRSTDYIRSIKTDRPNLAAIVPDAEIPATAGVLRGSRRIQGCVPQPPPRGRCRVRQAQSRRDAPIVLPDTALPRGTVSIHGPYTVLHHALPCSPPCCRRQTSHDEPRHAEGSKTAIHSRIAPPSPPANLKTQG